jgi:hypothetical protein
MTANQTWFEGKKFHLVPAAFRTAVSIFIRLNIFSQLVNKSDVDIRCEFSITGSLCYFYMEGVSTCRNN